MLRKNGCQELEANKWEERVHAGNTTYTADSHPNSTKPNSAILTEQSVETAMLVSNNLSSWHIFSQCGPKESRNGAPVHEIKL